MDRPKRMEGRQVKHRKSRKSIESMRLNIKALTAENAALKAKLSKWGRPTNAARAARLVSKHEQLLPLDQSE